MKISFGYVLEDGPFGGGNSVVESLSRLLGEAGHDIVWTLDDDDIDIIVLVDPRTRSPSFSYGAGEISRYLMTRNPRALVVQQIHDCDERKNTRMMNFRQRLANYIADHTVCVGSWMLALNLVRPEHQASFTAILNGGRTSIFTSRTESWEPGTPSRLVTHHWGANWMKGFDVYEHLDQLLDDPDMRSLFDMTYIGNIPAGFSFKNVRTLPPLSGAELADELRSHDVYITASINEPAGLHHIEGALCGLPILYRNSGALPEYCDGYGIMFEGVSDVVDAIQKMTSEYDGWRDALANYPHTEAKMAAQYEELFMNMLSRRSEIVANRNLWRNPLILAANQVRF